MIAQPPPGVSFEQWTRDEIARLNARMPQWRKSVTSKEGHPHGLPALVVNNWKVLYTNGSGQVVELALGADGTFLQANGASAAPTFAALVSGDLPPLWTSTAATLSGDLTAPPTTPNIWYTITSESGTSDTFAGFNAAGSSRDFVLIMPATGHTITITHNDATATNGRRFFTIDEQSVVLKGAVGSQVSFDWIIFLKQGAGSINYYEVARNVRQKIVPVTIWAASLTPTTTAGATQPTSVVELAAQKDFDFMDFTDSGVAEYAKVRAPVRIPVDYDGGTITAIFHWTANSASTNSVLWGCKLCGLPDNTALTTGWGTAQEVIDANGSSAYTNRITAATPAITPGGTPAGGNGMDVLVYRNSGDGSDNLAVTARLMSVTLLFTCNRIGSG